MEERLRRLFERIEDTPLTLGFWSISLVALVGARVGIEVYFLGIPFHFADQYFYWITHHLFTFSFSYLIALPIFAWFANIGIKKAATLLLSGFIAILLPPIVDELISQGVGFWSFYTFDSASGLWERYITFFGDKPDVGITYGTRVLTAITIIFTATYLWVRTKNLVRVFFGTITFYTATFLVGALPSLATFLFLSPEKNIQDLTSIDVAGFMLTPEPLYGIHAPDIERVLSIKMDLIYAVLIPIAVLTILAVFFRPTLKALWNNIRLPQVFYHCGLFLAGAGLVFVYESKTVFESNWMHWTGLIVMLLSAILAWITSVIVNDINDVSIDTLSNPQRPLVTCSIPLHTYTAIGCLTFSFSILFSALISTQFSLLLVIYQAIAWLYSARPLRLKRFPIIATMLASGASMLIFLSGYTVFSSEKNVDALPWPIPVLLFIAYTIIIPIKDFKDIAGDAADGVRTLPVILGETRAKRFIGAAVFIVFAVSPFALSVRSLFPLGLFFGTLGYWILQLASSDHRYLSYRKLPGWFILLVAGYGTFLAFALGK